MILAATISVIACHAETEKQADACGKHDSQCNRKALLTPNKQRHKGSPKRAKPYSSDGKGAPERHEVRRGCIDTKAPEQTQIRRFIIAAPHASIGQDCERFSTASIVGHGKRLTDGVQSYRSRSREKGSLFHITLNDRSWPNLAGRTSTAACQIENPATMATGWNRPSRCQPHIECGSLVTVVKT
jgi:hypothetical protein